VFESVDRRQADTAMRLLVQGSWKHRFPNTFFLSAYYRGGMEIYRRFSNENRSVNEWIAELELPVGSSGAFGLDVQERVKTFFHVRRGYAYSELSPYVRRRFSGGLNGTVYCDLSSLNYSEGTYFDCRSRRGGIRLEWALTSWMVSTFQCMLGDNRYRRQAYGFLSGSPYMEQWIALGQSQKDAFREWSVQVESARWLFVRLTVGYENNGSNNYGYGFRRPKMQFLAVKTIAAEWTVSIFWTSQMKRYKDSLRPILQVYPESENEENNFVMMDLTRTIAERTSLRVQAGLYRNESPFRDLYYRKTLYSIGIAHAF